MKQLSIGWPIGMMSPSASLTAWKTIPMEVSVGP